MITAKSLKSLIRYKLKDNNEVTYSDYDILQALNEVLRYVNQYYLNTDFLEKVIHYRQDDMNREIDEYNAKLANMKPDPDEDETAVDVKPHTGNDSDDSDGDDDTGDEDVPATTTEPTKPTKPTEPALEPKEHIDMAITGVDLPDDFLTVVRVVSGRGRDLHPGDAIRPPRWDEYKIYQNKLYTGVKDVDMLYNAAFNEFDNLEDSTVDLPVVFKDTLVKLACMILQNNADADVMQDAAEEALATVLPLRRYANAEKRMPFIC